MSAKKGRKMIETRTLLYILLVIIIIGGIYIFISSQGPAEKWYDPEYILSNKESFVESGETIIIEGYYDPITGDGSIVKSSYQDPGSEPSTRALKLDATNVANYTEKLVEHTKLHFTGHLEYIDSDNPFSGVVFIASEISDSW